MTSPDGITWTSRTSAANNSWRGLTYGNGLFVAVSTSGSGNRVMTSPDGITWTSQTSAADNNWQAVTYGNGLFVAVASSGTSNRVMTSPDGIIWKTRSTSGIDKTATNIAYGNGTFVVVSLSDQNVLTSGKADYISVSNNNIYQGGMSVFGNFAIGSSTNTNLFSVASSSTGTNYLTLTGTGLFGLGTTSPISTFALQGTGGTNPFTVASSTGASLFSILQNGNIGIGSSTPLAKLAVVGDLNLAQSGTNALIIGNTTGNARGTNAVDIQSNRSAATQIASSTDSTAIGQLNTVNCGLGPCAAVGNSNTLGSAGTGAISAFGVSNTALGNWDTVVGYNNSSNNTYDNASAFGSGNAVVGHNGTAVGVGNTASTRGSAFGYVNLTSGSFASAIGYQNSALNNYASAFGASSTASGISATAVGYNNLVSGNYASAFGYNNTASAQGASAFGSYINNNIASSTQIGPSDTAKITILGSGNVGIGTTSPTTTLFVQGVGGTNPFAIASSTGISMLTLTQSGRLLVGTTTDSIALGNLFVGTTTLSGTDASPLALSVLGNFENLATSSIRAKTISTLSTGSLPQSVVVSGNYAYVANFTGNSMSVIDISNPKSPATIATVSTGNHPQSVFVSGRYAYVANYGSSSMSIIDISNPASPTIATTTSVGATPNSVYVSGKYAYVVNYSTNILSIFDISNPTSPVLVSTKSTGTGPASVFVYGHYAYVTIYGGLPAMTIIDVSNPNAPVTASTTSTGSSPNSVYVSGRYAYVANYGSNSMSIIDISNPSSPITASTATISSPYYIYVSGRYAYVANYGSSTISTIDISSSTAPVLVSTSNTGTNPTSLFISGRYAYVTNGGGNTMSIVDLGGTESTAGIFHSLEAGNLTVRNDITAQGQLAVSGGVSIGSGGLFSAGAGSFYVATTTSLAGVSALSAVVSDNSTNSILDVLAIGRGSSGIAASGIGAGILFSSQNSAGTTATSSRIASILTNATAGAEGSALTFYTRSAGSALAERLRLTQEGYLFMGTTTSSASSTLLIQAGAGINPLTIASSTGVSLFSVIQNGNVGIGTSSPVDPFTIKAPANGNMLSIYNASGKNMFKFGTDISGANYPTMTFSDTSGNTKLSASGDPNVGPHLYVDASDYNKGEGSVSQYGAGLLINTPYTNGQENGVLFTNSASTVGGALTFYTMGAGNYGIGGLKLKTSSATGALTTRMVIDQYGDIGMGSTTTTIPANLFVQGSSSTIPLLTVASSSGTSYLTILSGGNIGIGTSTPQDPFTIKAQTSGTIMSIYNSSGQNMFKFGTVSCCDASPFFSMTNPAGTTMLNSYHDENTGAHLYVNGSVTDKSGANPTIFGAGIVIGTPTALGQENGLFFANGGSNIGGGITSYVTDGSNYGIAGLKFKTSSSTGGLTTKMTLDQYGRLGLGTTTPQSAFSLVSASTSIPVLTVGTSTNNSLFSILQNGNVGIGTSTPGQKLSILGSLGVSGAYFDGAYASGTLGMVLQTTGTSTQWVATSSLGITGGAGVSGGTFGYLARWTGATTLSTGLFLDNATVAGINATSSSYTFNVQGTAGTNPFAIASSSGSNLFSILQNGNVGIGTSSPVALLAINGEAYASFFTAASSTATSTFAGNVNVGGGNLFYNASTTVTSISSLELGNMSFDADAGVVTWTNIPITTASATGTPQSYTAQIGDTNILTVYGEADGQTSITNPRIGISTSTPTETLSLVGSGGNNPLRVSSSTNASLFQIFQNGNVAVGATSTPTSLLTVQGTASSLTPLFTVASSSNASLLTVLSNGNVGVGTSSPVDTLSINKSASVATFGLYGASANITASAGSSGVSTFTINGSNGSGSFLAFSASGANTNSITTGQSNSNLTFSNNVGGASTANIATFYNANNSMNGSLLLYAGLSVGTTSVPTSNLFVQGASTTIPLLTLASSTGNNLFSIDTNGRIITSTSSNASASVFINGGANSNVNSLASFAVGYQAFNYASTTTGDLYNTALGYQALFGSSTATQTGKYNTAIGYQALKSQTTAQSNIGIGYQALLNTTTGGSNIALGENAMTNNQTGSGNIALGYTVMNGSSTAPGTGTYNFGALYGSLSKLISGSYNVGIGNNSLLSLTTGQSNIGIGFSTLANSNGSDNIAMGESSFGGLTTGSANIAIGRLAGYGNGSTLDQRSVVDTYSTFIGYQASRDQSIASTTVLTNMTVIGKNARGALSNSIILGGTSTDAVTVGIGTTSPNSTLTITGNGSTNPLLIASSTGASLFSILANGNIGIGASTTPPNKLFVYNGAIGVQPVISGGTSNDVILQAYNALGGLRSSIGYDNASIAMNINGPNAGVIAKFMDTGETLLKGKLAIGVLTLQSPTFFLQGSSGVDPVNIASSSGSSLFTILQNGNVGIGTSTPGQKLSILGSLGVSGAFFDGAYASGTLGMVLQTTGTSTQWVSTSSLGIVGGASLTGGAFGYSSRWISASTLATSTLFDNGTVLGINATSSSVTFNIQGNAGTNPFAIASSTGQNLLAVDQLGRMTFGTTTSSNVFINGGATNTPVVDSNSIAIGNQALTFTSTSSATLDNIALGYQALLGSSTARMTGTDNIAVGYQAGLKNISGVSNSFIGYQAGLTNTSGSYNSFIGNTAGLLNTTGSYNSFIGYNAGVFNTTGTNNSFIGYQAGYLNSTGNDNIAIGRLALRTNSSGSSNIAFGTSTLYNTTGSNNIGLGAFAGYTNTTGGSNTFLGAFADASANNFSSSTAIGAGAIVGASNALILGGTGTSYVNVGIGTTTPDSSLTIRGTAGNNLVNIASSTGASLFSIIQNGNVGIGTSTPVDQFTVKPTANGNIIGLYGVNGSKIKFGTDTSGANYPFMEFTNSSGVQTLAGYGDGNVGPHFTINASDRTVADNVGNNYGVGLSIQTPYTVGQENGLFFVNGASGGTAPGGALTFFTTNTGNNGIGGLKLKTSSASSGLTTRLVIDQYGNIGMGSTTTVIPANLFVQGSSSTIPLVTVASSSGTSYLTILSTGNIGIGTTTPATTFSLVGTGGRNIFNIASSTGASLFSILQNGNIGIGTSTPVAPLAVSGEVYADFFTAASSTATSTFAGNMNVGSGNLFYNASTTVTSISSLELGNMAFDSDAGAVSWTDLPITTASATGTVESYSAQIGGTSILTVYGEADGQTSITRPRIGIGTTTPTATLSIVGNATDTLVSVASSSAASYFTILANGNIGIGSSTPQATLSLLGVSQTTAGASAVEAITAIGGNGSTTGAGGGFTFIGGNSANGTAGGFSVTAGNSATGGAITLTSGAGVGGCCGNGPGAIISMTGGNNSGGGGNISITGGTYAQNGNFGGTVTINGGTSNGGLSGSGNVLLSTIGGKVGIGTTSPSSMLTIRGTSTDLLMVASSSGTNYFQILSNGNVGIGSSTPVFTLGVAGTLGVTGQTTLSTASSTGLTSTNLYTTNFALSGLFRDNANASGTLGMVLQSTGTSTQWVATSSLGISGGGVSGGTFGYLARWTGATTLSTGLFLDNASVAGINATSSTYTFNVQGTAGVTPFNVASSTGTSLVSVLQSGSLAIATTSQVSLAKILIDSTIAATTSTTNAVAGIFGAYKFNPTTGGTQFGNRFTINNAPTTATNTAVGQSIRMADDTALANTVRGLEVVASVGANANGINTGIRTTGGTFGIQAFTTGLAGGQATPAALYGENTGTTQGDILRLYSASITSAPSMATLYQEISTFTGTGLLMNLGANGGSFTGNFADFQKNGVSQFTVTNAGNVSINGNFAATGTLAVVGNTTLANASTTNVTTSGSLFLSSLTPGSVAFISTGGAVAQNNAGLFFNNASTRLGVGTATPQATLSVQGVAGADPFLMSSSTGLVLLSVTQSGNVGIGTSTASTTLDIYKSTSNSNVDMFRIMTDVGSTANVKFRIDSDGDVFTDGGTTIGTPADLAENYPVATTSEPLVAGTVVSFASSTADWSYDNGDTASSTFAMGTIRKAQYGEEALGVISTRPGILLGGNTINGAPVAFSGRVPVLVTNENGPVKKGDSLTVSSDTPGYAMKATENGFVIGRAISDAEVDATSTTVLMVVENKQKTLTLSGIDGVSALASSTAFTAATTTVFATLSEKLAHGGSIIAEYVSVKMSAVVGYFDTIFAKKVYTDTLCVKKADGTNVCLTGDQVETMMNASQIPLMQSALGNTSSSSGTGTTGGTVLGASTSTEPLPPVSSSTDPTASSTGATASSTTPGDTPAPLPILDPTPPPTDATPTTP